MNILQNLYSEATFIQLHKDSKKIQALKRTDREIAHLPNSASCLHYAIKINMENKGIRIDFEYLSHLIFVDDIVLIANSTSKLQEMLQISMTLASQSALRCIRNKVMCSKHANKDDVIVNRKKIEEVDRYVYLWQMVSKDHNRVHEMKRRIRQGWSAF